MLEKKSCGENFPNPIVLYDQSVTSLGRDLKNSQLEGKLQKEGIKVELSLSPNLLWFGIDMVIYLQ